MPETSPLLAAPLASPLLLLSLLALLGLGGAGLLIANGQAAEQRLQARFALVLRERRKAAEPVREITRRPEAVGPLHRLLALFGCKLARRSLYPAPWWVVLLGTLAVARGVVALESGMVGHWAWLDMPLIWVMACRSAFSTWESKRQTTLLRQLPDALAMVVRCTRVGMPVAEAVRMAGREQPAPTGSEFANIAEAVAIGVPLDSAVRLTAERTGLPEYRFFAAALALQAQTGGSLSDSLDMLAEVVRKRVALRARGYALTAEARLSTVVLAAMPFVIMGMMLLINAPYFMTMFHERAGQHMLEIGLLSLITGVLVMRRIVQATLA